MRSPKIFLCLFLLAGVFRLQPLQAQPISVGMPFFEEALRRGQLLGKLDTNVSFNIRPVHVGKAFNISNAHGLDTNLFPLDTLKYATWADQSYWKGRIRLVALPVYTHTQFNQHHPYGWADGARIPNRGLQQYVSGGVYAKLGFLEMQYRPELVWAQNKDFEAPPHRTPGIDHPERMGTETYKEYFRGQSFIKAHIGPIAMGYSTENIWWGPGQKNAIILSNNAPGFGHATIHTNKPIKTRYGSIEFQWIAAALEHSGFRYPLDYPVGNWPPIGDPPQRDTSIAKYHSYVSAAVFSVQPKITPGLFIGATRIDQRRQEPEQLWRYLTNVATAADAVQTVGNNGIISVFARYLLPKAHAEFYVEMGREDWFWDMEDLITNPYYTGAWLAGFKKLYPLPGKDRWLEVYGEVTKIQAPVANYSRSVGYSFYTNGDVPTGWSHRGQVLGAGIGPGSNMNTLGVRWGKGFHTFGVHAERVVHNEDLLYNRILYLKLNSGLNQFFIDDSKHFVDWGIHLTHHTSFKKLLVGYRFHLMRTYNFNWRYDPFGAPGPFRFPGINVWSMNADISCVYRF